MSRYKTKSILIGRKKHYADNPDVRPCFVSLFNENDPHKSGETPFEVLEFEKIHRIIVEKLKLNYLLPGNDLVINDLEYVELKVEGPHIFITGKQKKSKK